MKITEVECTFCTYRIHGRISKKKIEQLVPNNIAYKYSIPFRIVHVQIYRLYSKGTCIEHYMDNYISSCTRNSINYIHELYKDISTCTCTNKVGTAEKKV